MDKDKQQAAIDKLDKEAEKLADNSIQMIAELMIQYITNYPDEAEKVLKPELTLQKGFEKVRNYARKHQHGGCAYVAPEKVFQMIFDYFGIEADVTCSIVAKPVAQVTPAAAEPAPKAEASVDINLDDFF